MTDTSTIPAKRVTWRACCAFVLAPLICCVAVAATPLKSLWHSQTASTAEVAQVSRAAASTKWTACKAYNPMQLALYDIKLGRPLTKGDVSYIEDSIEECEGRIKEAESEKLDREEQIAAAAAQLATVQAAQPQ